MIDWWYSPITTKYIDKIEWC